MFSHRETTDQIQSSAGEHQLILRDIFACSKKQLYDLFFFSNYIKVMKLVMFAACLIVPALIIEMLRH